MVIRGLTDEEIIIACVLLGAFGALADLIVSNERMLGPYKMLQALVAGAVIGLTISLLLFDSSWAKVSYKMSASLLGGIAWRTLWKWLKTLPKKQLSKVVGGDE